MKQREQWQANEQREQYQANEQREQYQACLSNAESRQRKTIVKSQISQKGCAVIKVTQISQIYTDIEYGRSIRLDGRCIDLKR